jgi:hypothetical protein
MTALQQNVLQNKITQIDLDIQTITLNGVDASLNTQGQLFQQVSAATQSAKTSLDSLQQTQKAIAKAIGIATAILNLATAIGTGDILGIGGAIVGVNSAANA